MGQVAYINTTNLRIARENRGLNTVSATRKISAGKKDLVFEWESGTSVPNWSQLEKLAHEYDLSPLALCSTREITRNRHLTDFRVGANPENDDRVYKLINVVQARQRWIEEHLKDSGYGKNTIQGSGKDIDSPKKLASFIADAIEINRDDILQFKGVDSRKDTLNYLIERAEDKGVFISKTISYHNISVDDMRGMFLANDYCPFIVINRQDALAAQIFTFIHELAHLFRKSDGISNSFEFRAGSKDKYNPEEILCNRVVVELMLPASDFKKSNYTKKDISEISDSHKLSELAIFYRLEELGKIASVHADEIEREIYREMKRNLEQKKARDKMRDGGNFHNSMRDSNGKLLNQIVKQAYQDQKIGYVEASKVLRCPVDKI